MNYDAIVVGAGISGAATAYHLRKAGAKTLLIERGEPASGGTGKSAAIIRQSYSTPLLVRLARASITMFENAKAELGRDAGFVQSGYCFVLSNEMLEGAKKNIAMQRGLGIVNEWSEGVGFPSTCPRSIQKGSPASSMSRTAATPIRYRRRRRMSRRSKRWAANSARVRRRAAFCAKAIVSRASSSTAARSRRTLWSMPPARGRSRSPRARGLICRCARCASRTRCGKCPPAARCRKPRSRWASTRPISARSETIASSSGAAFRRSTSTSIPTITRPPRMTSSSPMCKRASSTASRPSPA